MDAEGWRGHGCAKGMLDKASICPGQAVESSEELLPGKRWGGGGGGVGFMFLVPAWNNMGTETHLFPGQAWREGTQQGAGSQARSHRCLTG